MDIAGLKRELSGGKLRNLYIFVGDERGMMDLYARKIGSNVVKANKFTEIIPKLTGVMLFKQKSTYMIRDDDDLVKQDIDLISLIGDNIVILCYTNIDGRGKFYKQWKDYIISFDKLTEWQLVGLVTKELNISNQLASKVVRNSNGDFSRVELEIDKLKRLDEITFDIVYELVIPRPEDVVFDMVGYVTSGQALPAFDCFKELMAGGESPIKIISLFYTNFRNILLVQGMAQNTDKDIAAKTGLNVYHIKHIREKTNYYSLNVLLMILRLVQGAEFGIKTGKIDQNVAMEKLMIDILVCAEGN